MRWPSKQALPGGWAGQRVLITGASGGIGYALAEALAQRGAHLVISGRKPEVLALLVNRFPEQMVAVAADLTRAEERHRLVSSDPSGWLQYADQCSRQQSTGVFRYHLR